MCSIVDVMILADVFESFRSVSLTPGRFEIDPAHYVSAPQMAWDAMLKKTNVSLDLITDPAMYLMIESGMRGGVCMISSRYAHANNKSMGALYEPTKPSTYIIYLDANNLYGWAMSQYLPYGRFQWEENPERWVTFDWTSLHDTDGCGYIVECDLEYPAELHPLHNDYLWPLSEWTSMWRCSVKPRLSYLVTTTGREVRQM